MPTKPKPPGRLTRAHLTSIGMVVSYWAFLEDLMGLAVGALLCGNARHVERQIVAAQMDYRHRRDALMAFCDILPEGAAKQELADIMRGIETHAKIRDLAAHTIWTKGRQRGAVKPLTFRARGGSVKLRGHLHNEPNHTAASFEQAALGIFDLYARLTDFVGKAGRELFPTPAEAPKTANRRVTRSRTSGSKGEKPSQRS
jgi:hypothetical protein